MIAWAFVLAVRAADTGLVHTDAALQKLMAQQEGAAPEEQPPVEDVTLREPVGWCTDPPKLDGDDPAWCDHVPPDCPGLQKACADRAAAPVARETSKGCEPDRGSSSPDPLPTPSALPAPGCANAQWIFLGLVLGMFALALLERVTARRRDPDEPEMEPIRTDDPEPVLLPVGEDPLAAARRAAAAGRFAEALLLARTAAVRALEADGTLAPDPGRTDREAVRQLRGEPDLAAALRTVTTALERARYAALPVDRATTDAALAAAARLVARIGAAAVLLLAARLLLPSAWAGPADHDLLGTWAQERGFHLTKDDAFPTEKVCALWLPEPWATADDAALARDAAEAGAIVVVVGGKEELGWFASATPADGAVHLDAEGAPALNLPDPTWRITGGGHPFLVDAKGEPVALRTGQGDGALILVGLPHLFDDAALLDPADAAAAAEVLKRCAWGGVETPGEILQVERPSGTMSRALSVTGLGPGLAHVGLVWFLWAWARGRRFASPAPPPDDARRDFRAHLDAVAALYRRVGASRASAAAVSARALRILRDRTRTDDARLADAVAARADVPVADAAALLTRARAAAADPRGPESPDDLTLQEELWRLTERTSRTGSARSRSASPK